MSLPLGLWFSSYSPIWPQRGLTARHGILSLKGGGEVGDVKWEMRDGTWDMRHETWEIGGVS